MNFAHLHVHNEFSTLDGYGTAQQYVDEAVRLEHTHLALTNHGNIDGVIRFQKACRAKGIRPLIGCELYVVDDILKKEKGEKRYHMTVIVENERGWHNLLRLLSMANMEGFYYRPRVDIRTFLNYCEGLVVMTGCAMSVLHMGGSIVDELIEAVGKPNFFIELMPHDMEDQKVTNQFAMTTATLKGLNIVATNDCHYPTKEYARAQEMLLAIQSRSKWDDKDRWRFECDGLHMRSIGEMRAAFKRQGVLGYSGVFIDEALENTTLIAKMCEDFEIRKMPVELPSIFDNEIIEFRRLVRDGFGKVKAKIEKGQERTYRDRIAEELRLIETKGFVRYFLIVWELINWCKNNDIAVGPGRGSVGGSLVAYCLGITNVDPIKYRLLFARFISEDRYDLPDIDMDFEDIKRDKVRAHLEQMYGKDNVAGLSTFVTLKGKGAVRDVARVMSIAEAEIKPVLNCIDESEVKQSVIADVLNNTQEGRSFSENNEFAAMTMAHLEGQLRAMGQHAAAVCVSKDNLSEGIRCNLAKRNNVIVANWDKEDAEYMGLMKLDVLGLSALTTLKEASELIKQNHGKDIVYENLSMDDEKAYELLRQGYTAGVFQLGGSDALTRYCQSIEVSDFETIVHATSLWRPGPLRADMHNQFKRRKVEGEKYYHLNDAMAEITAETYGLIIYQEQVMFIMNKLAGMSWTDCEKVRKIIAKSKGDAEFDKFKKAFIMGCRDNNIVRKDAEAIWSDISQFGAYCFNRSHAVEYSMITYWDLWLKTYYPAEFAAASLTYGGDGKKDTIINEIKELGMSVRLPKVGASLPIKWSVKDSTLFAPFIEIKGVGEKMAEQFAIKQIESKRSGFFNLRNDQPVMTPKMRKLFNAIQEYEETGRGYNQVQDLFYFSIK